MAASDTQTGLGSTLGSAALIGIAASLLGPLGAWAEGADAAAPQVSGVVVTADKANSENAQIDIGAMKGAVKDTPQSIQIISPELIQQQKITSLEQALRDVPGITVAIGEGGTINGDQFKIYGQDANNDIYYDGLRDFGAYVRDSFDDQSVQVLKGPSAIAFGRGTTGAAINVVSKTPQPKDADDVEVAGGTAGFFRANLDLNQQLGQGVAARLVVMDNTMGEAGRNDVRYDRWGVAPSITFGLGGPTSLTLQYFFQHNNDRPDYGVPIALTGGTLVQAVNSSGVTVTEPTGAVGRPITELGVDRSTFYGYSADHDISNAHMLTARFSQKAADGIILTDDARAGYYTRDFLATKASCSSPTVSGTASTPHCVDLLATDPSAAVVGINGPSPYVQFSYGFQDIGAAHVDVRPLGIRNQAVVGFDVNYEYNNRTGQTLVPAKAATKSALDPSDASDFADVAATAANSTATTVARRISQGMDYAAFVSDQLWLTPQISVIGALRYDRYLANYNTLTVAGVLANQNVDSDLLDPKLALVFQPDARQTYYVSWSRSATPQGTAVATTNAAVTSSALQPEKNEIYAVGAKFSLLRDRLGLDASAFDIHKNNALQPDPDDPSLLLANSGQKQSIKGVEADITGKITRAWTVNFGYTYLDTKILSDFVTQTVGGVSTQFPNTFSVGKEIYYTPKNAATLWTAYDFGAWVKGLTLGVGLTYQDRVYTNYAYVTPGTGNVSYAPHTIDYSGLVQYRWSRYRLALNGYNLGDRINYSQVYTDRLVPEQGRTFIVTLGASF